MASMIPAFSWYYSIVQLYNTMHKKLPHTSSVKIVVILLLVAHIFVFRSVRYRPSHHYAKHLHRYVVFAS